MNYNKKNRTFHVTFYSGDTKDFEKKLTENGYLFSKEDVLNNFWGKAYTISRAIGFKRKPINDMDRELESFIR